MMKTYHEWLVEHMAPAVKNAKKPKAKKLKKNGGVHVDTEIAKRYDLIVLPPEIEGTNCGNCEYYDKEGDMGFCIHKDIRQWVTSRMCCNLWDHSKVKRSWRRED